MKKTDAVEALAALAQDSRLDVFRLLVQAGPEGMSAGAVSTALDLAPNTLTFHFDRLRMAGLVSVRREGLDDLRGPVRDNEFTAQLSSPKTAAVALHARPRRNASPCGSAQNCPPERPSQIIVVEEVRMSEIKEAVR